jgi:hypothetical protein
MELKTENGVIYCICDTCGTTFQVPTTRYGSKRRPRNYCSHNCRPSSQKKKISDGRASRAVTDQMVNVVCPGCNMLFIKDAWNSPRKLYCSVACRNNVALAREKNYRNGNIFRYKSCRICSAKFEIRKGNPIYCSNQCKLTAKKIAKPPPRELTCRICEETFTHTGVGGLAKHCSKECFDTNRFVVANPNCNPLEVLKLIKRRNAALICDVCRQKPKQAKDGRMSLHIDHDHATGRMRGVLCHSCNVIEGLAQGSPERLRMLAAWIESAVD